MIISTTDNEGFPMLFNTDDVRLIEKRDHHFENERTVIVFRDGSERVVDDPINVLRARIESATE